MGSRVGEQSQSRNSDRLGVCKVRTSLWRDTVLFTLPRDEKDSLETSSATFHPASVCRWKGGDCLVCFSLPDLSFKDNPWGRMVLHEISGWEPAVAAATAWWLTHMLTALLIRAGVFSDRTGYCFGHSQLSNRLFFYLPNEYKCFLRRFPKEKDAPDTFKNSWWRCWVAGWDLLIKRGYVILL